MTLVDRFRHAPAGADGRRRLRRERRADVPRRERPVGEPLHRAGRDARRASRQDPALVWRFYSERRRKAGRRAARTPATRRSPRSKQRMGDRFLLVTQNIDGLHQRAGSRRVIEIHGSLFRTRCFDCELEPFADEQRADRGPALRGLRRPAAAGGRLVRRDDRPRVLRSDRRFIDEARHASLVFLAVGTSGAVYPAAGLVLEARGAGGETWLVNAEPRREPRRLPPLRAGPEREDPAGPLRVALAGGQTRAICGRCSKWRSRSCSLRLCCSTSAAIQRSFVGIGVP